MAYVLGNKDDAWFRQPEPVRWREMLLGPAMTLTCKFENAGTEPKGWVGRSPFNRLTLESVAALRIESKGSRPAAMRDRGHPVTGQAVEDWIAEEARTPGFDGLLFQIGYANDELQDIVFSRFYARLYQIRLHGPRIPLQVFLWGTDTLTATPQLQQLLSWMSANRSLALWLSHEDKSAQSHICHHEPCGFHPLGLCKSFLAVPIRDYRNCSFPGIVDSLMADHGDDAK